MVLHQDNVQVGKRPCGRAALTAQVSAVFSIQPVACRPLGMHRLCTDRLLKTSMSLCMCITSLCIDLPKISRLQGLCIQNSVSLESSCDELDVGVPWVSRRLMLLFGSFSTNDGGGDGNQLSERCLWATSTLLLTLSHMAFMLNIQSLTFSSVHLLFCQPHAQRFLPCLQQCNRRSFSFGIFLGRLDHFSKTSCLCEFLLTES